jgi:hypothetical protein
MNVMGAQPISARKVPPQAMLDAADRLLTSLLAGNKTEVLAMTEAQAQQDIAAIAESVNAGKFDRATIIGRARSANHYFIKARLTGSDATPFTLQVRLGENNGRWTIREAINLTGVRSGWSV